MLMKYDFPVPLWIDGLLFNARLTAKITSEQSKVYQVTSKELMKMAKLTLRKSAGCCLFTKLQKRISYCLFTGPVLIKGVRYCLFTSPVLTKGVKYQILLPFYKTLMNVPELTLIFKKLKTQLLPLYKTSYRKMPGTC